MGRSQHAILPGTAGHVLWHALLLVHPLTHLAGCGPPSGVLVGLLVGAAGTPLQTPLGAHARLAHWTSAVQLWPSTREPSG